MTLPLLQGSLIIMWTCPACTKNLQLDNKTWRCLNGHAFDQAKEGYVNLQLAQERKSKAPGDSAEMISARRTFLNANHYSPLVVAITKMAKKHCQLDHIRLFDAGCGEGYYLNHVCTALEKDSLTIEGLGCDISKPAVQKAAKAYKSRQFSVASTFKIPLENNSVDVILQVFAPLSESEVFRILTLSGVWISVNPASRHLSHLKALIYKQSLEHKTNVKNDERFVLLEQQTIQFDMELDSAESRLALLKMTPYYWQTSEQAKQNVASELKVCEAHFDIKIWKKAQ